MPVFWFLYNLLFHLVYLLMLPYFLFRMRRRGGYRRGFLQRLAVYPPQAHAWADASGAPVWIHAVSVGEANVGLAFLSELRRRFPELRCVFTVNTSTAHRMVAERLTARDLLLYFPVDNPLVMRRAVRFIRPRALLLVETEVWPNLLRILRRASIPVVLLNGRVSDRSFARLQHLRGITRRVYPLVDLFCMQSAEDAARIQALGAPPERVQVLHSAKYDVAARDAAAEAQRRDELRTCGFLGDGPVLMGSSTWPGEEAVLCRVLKKLLPEHPGARLLLVPRHFERTREVVEAVEREGLSLRLRQEDSASHPSPQVYVANTTGELMHFYALADLVFVGKSLFRKEGQNPIEAASVGKALVSGPGLNNFRRVARDLVEADALCMLPDETALSNAVLELLRDPARTAAMGARAADLVAQRAGAISRSVDLVSHLL